MQVPTPQVSPAFNPTPNVRVEAPEAAFGTVNAEAASRFGQGLGAAGNELFARAEAMQQLHEQAAADNAHSQYILESGKLAAEYEASEGKNAVDGYQPYIAKLDQLRSDIGKGLDSEYAQKLYDSASRSSFSHSVMSGARHAATQNRHYQIGTIEAGNQAAREAVAGMPGSEGAYTDALSRTDSSGKMMQAIHGWSDAQRDEWVSTEKSKTVYARATELSRTDPAAARRVLDDAVKDRIITGEMAGRAGDFIRTQLNGVTSRVESQRLLEGDGGQFGQGKVPVSRAREAIGAVEGSGNYNPPHPAVTHKVNGQTITERALGRYGIMQSNLAPWLKEAGMPAMSADEFLHDHDAQDKLFDFKFGQLMDKYGSANKAAMAWFTGSPEPDARANDGHTSAPAYLKRFNAALGQSATKSEVRDIALTRAKELAPDDDEFHQIFTDKTAAEHAKSVETTATARREQWETASSGLTVTDPNGALVTSVDQFPVEAREAYFHLPANQRNAIDAKLAANAGRRYEKTPENQSIFNRWMGAMADDTATDEDRKDALGQNFYLLQLPTDQIQQLVNRQKALRTGIDKGPNFNLGLRAVNSVLDTTDFSKDEKNEFRGVMRQVMQDYLEQHTKQMSEEEILAAANRMLQQQSYKSKGWMNWLSGGLLSSAEVDSEETLYKTPVPEKYVDKIKADYAARYGAGAIPSEKQIQQIYVSALYTSLYSKQKAPAK